MESYREEVHLKLRAAVVKQGISLRTLAAHTELSIDELRTFLNDRRATTTCIGRLHSYFHADSSKKTEHLKRVASQETKESRYSTIIALWRELAMVWNVVMPNPGKWQHRDADFRRAMYRYYDLKAKEQLLRYIGRRPWRVSFPDYENYWQWKIRLGKWAKPESTMQHWLRSLPSSVPARARTGTR